MLSGDFILILGSQDRLSKNLAAYMNVNAHQYFILDETTLPTIGDIPCGQSLKDFSIDLLSNVKLSLENCKGILVNHFTVPDCKSSEVDERFWSEWNAFFGGAILSQHHNVINPPNAGSWCGDFPTIFRQLSIFGANEIDEIEFPDLKTYFQFVCGSSTFDKNILNGQLYIPYEYWDSKIQQSKKTKEKLEVSCCYIDGEYIFEGSENFEARELLSSMASIFSKNTNSRIGEISCFIIDKKYYFRYALTRPILNSFRGVNRYRIIEQIYKALAMDAR